MFGAVRGMSETDFRFIYGMEYFHRMFGRAIGVVFVAPALYFAARGWLRGPLAGRVALLFAAGGAQGLVGWWMVRSGLQARALPLVCAERPWSVGLGGVLLAGHCGAAVAVGGAQSRG